jgi:hypothetical protein
MKNRWREHVDAGIIWLRYGAPVNARLKHSQQYQQPASGGIIAAHSETAENRQLIALAIAKATTSPAIKTTRNIWRFISISMAATASGA